MSRPAALVVVLAVALVVAAPLAAAPPTVPTSLPYQGLLLDGLGAPRTGSVDLTLRIFDGVVGGTLVYKQTFPGVALADGVFTVQLGPTGDGTDAPANPLTTSLATALAGDAGATAPLRFLEVTVNAEGALARTQILASAYAVRASSAASADVATTATTATDVVNVGGVGAAFVAELYQHVSFDGGAPPNDDPREGLGDVDGDGVANFVDSDNDDDGQNDSSEVAQGTDINLVTPIVSAVSPTQAYFTSNALVTVTGSHFQPPLAVTFGTETPAATNVTSTSFQVSVGPQPPGAVNVQVSNANGQSDLASGLFTWRQTLPHSVLMNPGSNALQSSIDVRPGTNEVVFSGQKQYGLGDVNAGLVIWPLQSRGVAGQIATAFEPGTNRLVGVRCGASGTNCSVELYVDADGDGDLQDGAAIPIDTIVGSNALLQAASLGFAPGGGRVVGYQRFDGALAEPRVAHDRNADGDFADANEVVAAGSATLAGAVASSIAVDSAGRVAFLLGGTSVAAAWDRNGDGDFADGVGAGGELFTVQANAPSCIGSLFDPNDRLAAIYVSNGAVTLARDLDGDGDFTGAGESTVLLASGGTSCDIDWPAGQPFAVAYSNGASITVRQDENADGDFDDAGETSSFAANPVTGLRMRGNGTSAFFLGYSGSLGVVPTN